jgi:ATP-dependent Clp protease ATP-binding subunit ClpC
MAGYDFTPAARRVLSQACREAADLQHGIIGTEHVLLALLRVKDAELTTTFARVGLDPVQLRHTTRTLLGMSPAEFAADHTLAVEDIPELPFTHRMKDAIECAMRESEESGTGLVSPSMLLVGLLREGKGIAVEALARHGITIAMARDAMHSP